MRRFFPLAALMLAVSATGRGASLLPVTAELQQSRSAAGSSFAPIFSGDGLHLVFLSHANNLVTNDDLAPWIDVFSRDLASGNTTLVSVNTNGIGGGNSDATSPSISSNGQFVAFVSRANDLVADDINDAHDVFVRDVVAGSTRLVSTDINGKSPTDPQPYSNTPLSGNPMISGDGRWVFFESRATNLTAQTSVPTAVNLYARDLWSNVTVLVSADTNGLPVKDVQQLSSISGDGRFAAFISTNTSLVRGLASSSGDVFVRDMTEGKTICASTNVAQNAGLFYQCREVRLSATPHYVAFTVSSTNGQAYRYDLFSAETIRVSVSCGANLPVTGPNIDISNDGGTVAFDATVGWYSNVFVWRTNVCTPVIITNNFSYCPVNVGGGLYYPPSPTGLRRLSSDGTSVLFVDLCDGSLNWRRIVETNSTTIHWSDGRGDSAIAVGAALSADGHLVAFDSVAPWLAAGDYNGASDIFLRDPDTGTNAIVSRAVRATSTPAAIGFTEAGRSSISSNGAAIVFTQTDQPSAVGDNNGLYDVYFADMQQGTRTRISTGSNGYLAPIISADSSTIAALRYDNVGLNPAIASMIFIARASNGVFYGGLTPAVADRAGLAARAYNPSLSGDGRLLAFCSDNDSMSADGDYNNASDVFVRNYSPLSNGVVAATNYLISRATNGGTGIAPSTNPVISLSGRWVVFATKASNLVAHPPAPEYARLSTTDVASWSLPYSTYQLVAVDLGTDRQATNYLMGVTPRLCSYAMVSNTWLYYDRDGKTYRQTALAPLTNEIAGALVTLNERYVVFGLKDGSAIYRHDLLGTRTNYYAFTTSPDSFYVTNTIEPGAANFLVCTNCWNPSVSADGNVVAYERPRAGTMIVDLYATDLRTGAETLISASAAGTPVNGSSTVPLVSADGRYVVFQSRASNLVPGDTNEAMDIFVRDRLLDTTLLVSVNGQGRPGNGPSSNPVLGADGRTVVFQSFANDLVAGDFNDRRDIFVLKLGGADTDGDGMDDDWEVAYFGDLTRDGTGDFDNDGVSDRDEFLSGTDPTNAASVLRVLSLTAVGAGTKRLIWSGNVTRTYRVEYKDNLTATSWNTLEATPVWNGTTATVSDSQPATNRFYRISGNPPP